MLRLNLANMAEVLEQCFLFQPDLRLAVHVLQAATPATPENAAPRFHPVTGGIQYLFGPTLCNLAGQSRVSETNTFTCKCLIDKNDTFIDVRNATSFIG
jgi:hypothetical protein